MINNLLLVSFISLNLPAVEDANSFCFEKDVSVTQVEKVISFLITGNDRINLRDEDHCVDIVTSSERIKIYEKLIWKNFKPLAKNNFKNIESNEIDLNQEHCHLVIREIKKNKNETNKLSVIPKTNIEKSIANKTETVTQELMILRGKSASMKVGNQFLQIQCIKNDSGRYQLTIYLDELNKNSISTSVDLKESDIVNLGNIKKELNEKSKTIGLTQLAQGEQASSEDITYELSIK